MILCNSDHVLFVLFLEKTDRLDRSSRRLEKQGWGETTFAQYLSRWLLYVNEASLEFAATMASIKIENPGPVYGTLENRLDRMSSD